MKKRLGDLLVEHNLITDEELDRALKSQKSSTHKRLGKILLESDQVTKNDLLKMLALQLEMPFLDLESLDIDSEAVRLFPEKVGLKYGCVPVKRKGKKKLIVAMADPLNLEAIDDLIHITKHDIRPAVADRDQIEYTIKAHHSAEDVLEISNSLPELDSLFQVIKTAKSEELRDDNVNDLQIQSQQAPIVKIVNIIINEAIREGATDIHVEPQAESLIVRDRIDGMLYEKHHLPKKILRPVVSRIKIMADMDIAEKRIPQDGKVRIAIASRNFDLRVSTLPAVFGEKVVIRLLERNSKSVHLDDLGFTPSQLKQMRTSNSRRQGLILVTGPTGSGKSTTLHAMLRELRNPNVNIVTVEDPVEYEIPRITQVQVNSKSGLGFAEVLRSMLRQDPDIIMVGEIRDPETAEIALRAAMTGHLVLSTLHTNDAPSAVTRLENLGMPPFLISSTLLYVLAQRLVRKLCKNCTTEYEPSGHEVEQIEPILPEAQSLTWRKGTGCSKCHNRGFAGRVAVSELLVLNNEMKSAIEANEPESVIQRLATLNGMRSLLSDFVEKASIGQTALSEIWSVVIGDSSKTGICPNCSSRIEQSYLSCPACGFALKEKCPECEWTLEKTWRFCPHCQWEREALI
jgi:type IV pilus assembly protein PilB